MPAKRCIETKNMCLLFVDYCIHNILGVSETAVENNISFLRENGYIERVGSKKAGYWKVL